MSPSRPIAVVTGGSRGIGAATATLLAKRGYDLCINYLSNADAAEQTAEECTASGARAIVVQGDMSTASDVERLFDSVDSELGRVAALVNNVGILDVQSSIEDMDAERFERVLRVNVLSAFLCSKAAFKRMATKHGGDGGAIVNVSSMASRLGSPFEYVDYAASKGAMDSFTIGFAKEAAPEGVRVNAVRPGVIRTDIHATGGMPDRVDRLGPDAPLGRGGEPEEVATAVAWLLSDEASYVTGSFIDVSGGR
ncbi:MAG: SDR family oxidoreductase [Woeseiaceae bacterium]|nr:SDR family oxidoreductase [Woeseiaceae bacterium]